MNKPNLNHLLLDELDKFPITSMASNKMTKPTYCPHCWAELTIDDTTCYQCGEAVAPSVQGAPQTESHPKRTNAK